jgi:hypothetical protein
VKIDFGFLEAGEYYTDIYTDAVDANSNPQNVQIVNSDISSGSTKTFHMAKGGGLAMVLTKKNH